MWGTRLDGQGRAGRPPGSGDGAAAPERPLPGLYRALNSPPLTFKSTYRCIPFSLCLPLRCTPNSHPTFKHPLNPSCLPPPQAAKVFQMLFCSLPPLYFLLTVGSRPHFQRTYIPFSQETVQVIQVEIQHYHLPQSHECLLLMSDYLRSSAASPK